jgi:hypothetical protein
MSIYVKADRLPASILSTVMAFSSIYCSAATLVAQDGIHIVVVEGEGAINNTRSHTSHDPVVEVSDESNKPVEGASVTFQTPGSGASAEFGDGIRSFVTQTDSKGDAVGRGLRPNTIAGPFEIRVTASYRSHTANAVIPQTNAAPVEAKSSKKIWIIGLAAAGAAGAAFAASHGGKSNSTSGSSTPGSGAILPGSPVFGPPQ